MNDASHRASDLPRTEPARVTSPRLGLVHLETFWSRTMAQRTGGPPATHEEWSLDGALMGALGINVKETLDFLFQRAPTLAELEQWIVETNGGAVDPERIARFNAAVAGTLDRSVDPRAEPALGVEELRAFDEQGYVVLHDAVTAAQCAAAVDAIAGYLGARLDDPSTWYAGPQGASIWVPFVHHPALEALRASPRIGRAFEQLWGCSDLWPVIDQSGFNPPEGAGWRFPGPHLHWDVSLVPPIPLGLQGILYLTDTEADQGAFTCVPGFHRRIDAWLAALPPGVDPRKENVHAFGPVAVPGRAGDMVIWHQALPHGSRPNRSTRPRIVEYLTMRPTRWVAHADWR